MSDVKFEIKTAANEIKSQNQNTKRVRALRIIRGIFVAQADVIHKANKMIESTKNEIFY